MTFYFTIYKSELSNIMKEYDSILDMWEQELRDDIKNYLFDDELQLFNCLKYDNKVMNKELRDDIDEILYILKGFKV